MLTARDVTGLQRRGSARVLHFEDGSNIAAHAVVLATGVSYRRLAALGADDFAGRGVYYGAAAVEAPNCREQDVYIVGGANSAGQAAVFLSPQARSVTLLVRGESLERSMSQYLIEQPRTSTTSGSAPASPSLAPKATTISSRSRSATRPPGSARRCRPAGCSCSSARRR